MKICLGLLFMNQINLSHSSDQITAAIRWVILESDHNAFFKCDLNGYICWLPAGTLRTMIHCVTKSNLSISVEVETPHIKWMIEQIRKGEGDRLFIDVGAATGAASIPMALEFHDKVKIIAFEPASAAIRLLKATLEKK
jgi:hypothetical protein